MSTSKPPTSEVRTGLAVAQLRARVIDLTTREPSPTRAQLSRKHRLVLCIAMLVPLLVFIGWGGIRVGPRPERLVLETALGSAVLAAGVAIVGIGRGRSMLGRPRAWLVTQVLLTPVLLFGWRVLTSAGYPNMMNRWLDRPGFRCLSLSLILALAPLLGLLWLRRGSDPVQPRLTAAAVGAGVGAGAWLLVDLWCPVGYVPHLLLGHVLPLLVLIALSALVGSRVIAVARGRGTLAGR
ncbi:MAG TPA: NrsF family protein [Polyangiaceae bacterium]|nr:NrsF family protein [Polyangiaceae bacterium]